MPLPSDPNQPWPPRAWQPIQHEAEEAAVWYGGDPEDLALFYGTEGQQALRPSDRIRGDTWLNRFMFWARRYDDQNTTRQRMHMPAAADIAATSADLLFGEQPTFTIPEAHGDTPDSEARATEERLAELVDLNGVTSTLLEGAEVCSAVGDIYLRPVWDSKAAPHPMLTVVHGDHAVPEFRWGQLRAVTFWRVVLTDGAGAVWRLLERYEPGVILTGLYVGRRDQLGRNVGLSALDATRDLPETVELPAPLNDTLIVSHVPNVRPNRRHRELPIGRSDIQGSVSPLDALDETWTSWVRDVRLAKARIIVPDEFLQHAGRGKGASFDADREIFSPLAMDPMSQDKAGITLSQFEIRWQEHSSTIEQLLKTIVATAGYSPTTFGLQAERTEITATEVRARENKTLRTTGRKQRYWRRPLEESLETILVLDSVVFRSGVTPMRPRVDWADGLPDDPRQIAETIQLLTQARAVSVETAVKMAQPELEGDELKAEVDRILDEQGLRVESPDGRPPNITAGSDNGQQEQDEGEAVPA